MRPKVLTAFFLALLVTAVFALPGDGARAQRRRAQKPQPAQAAGASAPAPQQDRPKQVIIGRGSDTARGSRMTITSDNPLNDYSAYRSGDRFYVELPNADANTMARAAGKGFSDLQVQRRGKNVVLSYRVQPGAKPRVEQRFNRLDVVFEAPEGAPADTARAPQQTPAAEETRTANTQNQAATQAAPPAQNPNAAEERRQPSVVSTANNPTSEAAQPSLSANAPGVGATQTLPSEQPSPVEQTATPLPTPTAAPTGANELAQAQPPAATAPVTTTADRPDTQTGATLGAVLLRNWWMLVVAALLVLGIGLLLAARKSSATKPAPVEPLGEAPAPALKGASAARLKDASDAGLKEASAVAAAAATATAFKQETDDRKKKNRGSKKKGKGTPAPVVAASAAAVEAKSDAKELVTESVETPAAATAEETKTVETAVAETAAAETEAATPVVAETATVEPAVEEPEVKEPVVEESVAEEPAAPLTEATVAGVDDSSLVAVPSAVEAAEAGVQPAEEVVTSTEIEPAFVPEPVAEVETAAEPETQTAVAPFVSLDPESVQAEARSLLDGARYDPNVVGTSDAMARQMIAAELLSALAGRNAERRERARVAFHEHGYYDEKLKDLSTAEAAAERASAARALGSASDRSATPHLANALEDDAVEVRRAAVDALASLRDPAAVEPLEALLQREKKSRDKVNRKLVEHAIYACREGEAEAPAPVAAPPAEVTTHEAEAATVAEAAPVVEETTAVEETTLAEAPPAGETSTVGEAAPSDVLAPVGEADTLEAAPPPSTGEAASVEGPGAVEEVEAPSAVEEYPVEEQEAAYAEETLAAEPAAPSLFEKPAAEAAPELLEAPASATEAETVEVKGLAPAFEFGAEEAESHPESLEASPADEDEVAEASPFVAEAEPAFEEVAEAQAEVEVSPAEAAQTSPPEEGFYMPSDSVETPPAGEAAYGDARAGEWVELDMNELGADAPPAPAESFAPLFETSAGEPVVEGSAFAEPAAEEEARPAVAELEAYREEAAEDVSKESALEAFEPAAGVYARTGEEKGVELFNEHSTVPAAIQHRLASQEPSERASAVTELAHVDTGEAFQQICAAFDDDSKEVRSAAARALFDLHGDRAESFTRALREASPERRRNIGAAINSSGLAADAVSQLTGESREKTYEAFSLLFLMAKAGEVQPLIRAIEGHPSNEVRLAVVKLLALSGQSEILPAFRRLAVRGSLPTDVRSAVMEAIYQISSQQPTAPHA